MTHSVLRDALDGIDSRFLEEALDEPKTHRTPLYAVWIRCAAVAACLILAAFGIFRLYPAPPAFIDDKAVTVTHLPLDAHPQYPFVEPVITDSLTAADISFSDLSDSSTSMLPFYLNQTDRDVFEATVTELETLELDFDGEYRYVLLATVQVNTVHRGELSPADETTVWLNHTLCDKGDDRSYLFYTIAVGDTFMMAPERADVCEPLLENSISLELADAADYVLDSPCFYPLTEGDNDK